MNYYELEKDKRWLEGDDSPYGIGGRDTDVAQIAYSLGHRIREIFPINQVPQELVAQLDKLVRISEECEAEIEKTIDLISQFISVKD